MRTTATPQHYSRKPEIFARETEIVRLITLWRSRDVSYDEISERLTEKGFMVTAARARKIMQGQSV